MNAHEVVPFQEHLIASVDVRETDYVVRFDDGWLLVVDKVDGLPAPQAGETLRTHGRGLGYAVEIVTIGSLVYWQPPANREVVAPDYSSWFCRCGTEHRGIGRCEMCGLTFSPDSTGAPLTLHPFVQRLVEVIFSSVFDAQPTGSRDDIRRAMTEVAYRAAMWGRATPSRPGASSVE